MQKDPTQAMGKGMAIIAWVLGLGLLTLWFSNYLDNKRNPNQLPDSVRTVEGARVVLKQNGQGHYVANGSINGMPVTFLLDTGATQVSVPARLQQALGLEASYPSTVSTANGTVTVYATEINTLKLGDIELHGVRAHINPGQLDDEVLLGMSVLRQLDFEQRDRTLILKQYK